MRCPYCQKENPDQAKFCIGCGRKLEISRQLEADPVSLQDAETEEPKKTENVQNHGTKPSTGSSEKPKKKKTGYLVILAVFLVVVLAVSLFSCGGGESVDEDYEEEDEAELYLEAAQNYGEVNARLIDVSEGLDDEDITTDEAAELYLEILSELEAEGLIQESSVVYDESISEISYRYADGAKGSIQLEEIEEGTSGYGLDTYVTGYDEDGYTSSVTTDPVSFDIEGYPYEEEDLSAYACWGLGEGYEGTLEIFEDSVINWNKAYLTSQIDYDLTLAELRSDLKGYDLVVIQLHGASGTGYPVLEEGETFTEHYFSSDDEDDLTEEEIAAIEDLQAGRVEMKTFGLSGNTFNYVACPEFFTYYYGDNGLEGSIVWLGCCEGYLYDDLVNAFYSCGASAVLACTESVKTVYNVFMLDTFVYSLLYGNTVDESLSFAQSVWGENDSIFWERYASGQDDYEADTSPSEIRYCEGSADAVLVTLTEEAVTYVENPRIMLDDYLDDFDAFYELVGGSEYANLTDHDMWIVGDGIEYGNDQGSSSVNDLSISSHAYELFDLYVGMKIDDAGDLLSDWEEDNAGDGWIHWSRDTDALCLYYDSGIVTTIQYSHEAEQVDETAMYQAYYDKLISLSSSAGEGEITDLSDGAWGYLSGLCYAQLKDIDDDDLDELLLAWLDAFDSTYEIPSYTVEIWDYTIDDGLVQIYEGSEFQYNGDACSIPIYIRYGYYYMMSGGTEDFAFYGPSEDGTYTLFDAFEYDWDTYVWTINGDEASNDDYTETYSTWTEEIYAEYMLESSTDDLEVTLGMLEETMDFLRAYLGIEGEEETVIASADEDWKEAFIAYIESDDDADEYEYSLIFIDDDDIPELYIDRIIIASGSEICVYYDGSAADTDLNHFYIAGSYGLYYLEREGLLCVSGGMQGYYGDEIYSLISGYFNLIGSGFYESSGYFEMDSVSSMTWDGESVDSDTYLEILSEWFDEVDLSSYDFVNAVSASHDTYSKDEIIEMIEDY